MTALIMVTGNDHKFAEASTIGCELGLEIEQARIRLVEIQTADIDKIVVRKAKDAFARIGRPLFVEHTCLHIEFANGLPAGLTRTFLKTLGDDKVCELFGVPGRNKATGKTTIGYCDGRKVHQLDGELHGVIAERPSGELTGWEQFGWSRLFIPDGYSRTLSDLGIAEKNKFSMRRAALTKLAAFLKAPT
jgi:XTP/dITP diphosphohydrolase